MLFSITTVVDAVGHFLYVGEDGFWLVVKYSTLLLLSATIINWIITPGGIKNLPMAQTRIPFVNGLSMIIPQPRRWEDSPCLQFYRLSKTYGEVYQIRFGTRLIVVANSFETIRQLWGSRNVKGNNSRPVSYSFHRVLSKGVYTIGTTPIGQSYRNARKHLGANVLSDKRNNEFNCTVLNKACDEMIGDLVKRSTREVHGYRFVCNDLLKIAQYFHLKVALWITYGFELNITDRIHRSLADEIIQVENSITKVRSHIQNVQDYLPWGLRIVYGLFSNDKRKFRRLYHARERYLTNFHLHSREVSDDINTLVRGKSGGPRGNDAIANGSHHPSDVGEQIERYSNTLMYRYFNDTGSTVTLEEITSECLTMVSAGLDNTPLNFKYGLHQLVNYHPDKWETAYQDLVGHYGNDRHRAYEACAEDLRSEYVKAVVHETLRLFTVLPLALPRESTCSLAYKDVIIPPGTTLFLNCWAGNHDETRFAKPMEFIPERWLTSAPNGASTVAPVLDASLSHLAFGAGCRKCLGSNFAVRELYILFAKMVLRFTPATVPGATQAPVPPSNPLQLNQYPGSLAIEPPSFDLFLQER